MKKYIKYSYDFFYPYNPGNNADKQFKMKIADGEYQEDKEYTRSIPSAAAGGKSFTYYLL